MYRSLDGARTLSTVSPFTNSYIALRLVCHCINQNDNVYIHGSAWSADTSVQVYFPTSLYLCFISRINLGQDKRYWHYTYMHMYIVHKNVRWYQAGFLLGRTTCHLIRFCKINMFILISIMTLCDVQLQLVKKLL